MKDFFGSKCYKSSWPIGTYPHRDIFPQGHTPTPTGTYPHREIPPLGHPPTGTSSHRDITPQGHLPTGTSHHRDIPPKGHPPTGTSSHRNILPQGPFHMKFSRHRSYLLFSFSRFSGTHGDPENQRLQGMSSSNNDLLIGVELYILIKGTEKFSKMYVADLDMSNYEFR